MTEDLDKALFDIFGARNQTRRQGPLLNVDGAKMTAIRQLQGISVDMLVGLTGYSVAEIKAIEAGRMQVDRTMLLRLGARLKCRPEDLLKS